MNKGWGSSSVSSILFVFILVTFLGSSCPFIKQQLCIDQIRATLYTTWDWRDHYALNATHLSQFVSGPTPTRKVIRTYFGSECLEGKFK